MSRAVSLYVGAVFTYDGELCEVVQLDGVRITVRSAGDKWRTVRLAEFLTGVSAPALADERIDAALGPALAGLSEAGRAELAERSDHVREALSGYRSGTAELARPGEPRPEFDPARPMADRYAAKAAELGIAPRTVERWAQAYRTFGEAGLLDARKIVSRRTSVDPRWEDACRQVIAERVRESTPTSSALLMRVEARLEEAHGPGVVPCPPRATAYRHLARLAKGTNALRGSAKARRSIAERPKGTYGRLRATRPGEFAILDTQSLDVYAMEPVTCRWVKAELTVAQDLFTRCILALRVTPVSTKAVDVAGLLYQTVTPTVAPLEWPEQACWPYHGIPQHLVFSEDEAAAGVRLAGVPVCPPETLVVDHGKVFVSAHVISVCARLGISIQPATPKKPTDKPTVERFFRTLREGLIQHLPAYKGPDIHSRGDRVEDAAFLYLHELEDVIREWVALIYHRTRHDGLAIPEMPGLALSPNEMYETGIAKAGLLRVPRSPDLVYDFLPVHFRSLQHYGVEVGGLRYNGPALDPYRNSDSPYGGIHTGKWPIRVNPDDVRYAYFQDPADNRWHRLVWEHAPGLGTPFSADAAQHARRLALRAGDRRPDAGQALAELLARWDTGMVSDRRERRMAVRLAAERQALPMPEDAAEPVTGLPTLVALAGGEEAVHEPIRPVEDVRGDDDTDEEIFDSPDDDFYADAFEVLP
ncbi:transposase [Frankia sp. CNm7]|uniref:Transposase n=1 Tax=Frankia nepalensis TaxID=1836974 RepID=A0A937RLJ3_9ACTN|nr:helix-turn-helix domain-containing protein [Frankia nepalensis]MBL7495265.1 transposase [Frankia nepalensis]MBL7515698.1 transposase [Frankia nepalensis]MBL7519185.1 transposase [Frankia nepalensis]MBL7632480.1 transposase [Frankia nepalensis]